ncbi:MAG: CCA tRNA nucleotidyltransferase [Desulfobacter sp.]|nr:CCA tRNA nucleotidyltransferase [Desulfobacter sp.]
MDWPGVGLILERLSASGRAAFIVGGAVRDMIMGLDFDDVDILTRSDPEDVEILFKDQKTKQVGQAFPITLVNGVEVASCRSECSGADFPISDLGMRDFTINAMALDPFSGTLIDPFKGKEDIKDGIIRFTRDPVQRIKEDPLRMVRACRFAAKFCSRIEPASFAAIKTHRQLIADQVSKERIRLELIKAMVLDFPSLFLTLLHDTGLLGLILPSLDRCHTLDGGPFHGETVFEHCLLVGDALPFSRPLLRLAGYLHDVGKYDAARIKQGQLTFAGHEQCCDALENDLARLRFSGREAEYILSLVKGHMPPLNEKTTPKAVRRLLVMLADLNLSHKDFLRMRIADKKGNLAKSPYTFSQIRIRLKKILDEISNQAALNINDLEISGRDIQNILSMGPGPGVGKVKKKLFDQVVADPSLNTREALERLIRGLLP